MVATLTFPNTPCDGQQMMNHEGRPQEIRILYRDGGHNNTNVTSLLPGRQTQQHKRHESSTGTADTSIQTSRVLYRDGGHNNTNVRVIYWDGGHNNTNVTSPLPGRRTQQHKRHESSTGTADTTTQTSRVLYRDGGHNNTNVTSPLQGRRTHQHKRITTDNEYDRQQRNFKKNSSDKPTIICIGTFQNIRGL